jgi:F0F1-type ATP synthase gamma subunit
VKESLWPGAPAESAAGEAVGCLAAAEAAETNTEDLLRKLRALLHHERRGAIMGGLMDNRLR